MSDAAALYWAVMTITSVGYGDVAATPQEPTEAVVAIFLMLGLAFVWSNLIGIFCSVLSNMNPGRQVCTARGQRARNTRTETRYTSHSLSHPL